MISETAIKERAKEIDPCAFKSYSGSARRDAQQEALDQARRELDREPHAQRRYTIDEIDRMRTAIQRVQPLNYMNRPTGQPSVEEQLRTAMLGGVSAQELEDKAALYWEAIRQRREAKQAEVRERDADAARVRAGGYPIAPPDATAVAEKVTSGLPLNSFWRRELANRIEDALRRFGWRT